MGKLSLDARTIALDAIFQATLTPSSNMYLALCTADPTEAGTGALMSEVANAYGYARTLIPFKTGVDRQILQDGAVTFPIASGSWGTITHWAITPASSYGTGVMLAFGEFSVPITVVSGNAIQIPDEEIQISVQATPSGAGFSNYLINALLGALFRNVSWTKPSTYLALSATVLADDDVADTDFTEVTGLSYARKLVNPSGGASPTWDAATDGYTQNTHDIEFDSPTGTWDELTSVVLVDSASGAANVLMYDNANVPSQVAESGDTVKFAAGDFYVILS